MAVKKAGKKVDEQRLRRQIRYLVAGLVLVFIVASVLIVCLYNENTYVAKVGGEKITKAEYMMIFNQEKQYMMDVFGISEQEAESFWNTKIEGEYAIDRAKKGALDMAWESKIQCIKAREKGISITNEEKEMILSLIDGSIPENYRTTTEKNDFFNDMFGITYKEFKGIYTDLFLIKKFIDTIYEEMEASYDEVKEFYENNRDDLDSVTVRHILVKVGEEDTAEKKQAAREKSEEILEKVVSGEDFASLASEYSDDEYSRDMGGEYTFTKNDNYVDEFKDWAFEHGDGDTGIVETDHGFHVMELVERRIGFEEIMEDARVALKNKKFIDMLEEWKGQPEFRLIRNDKVYNSIS